MRHTVGKVFKRPFQWFVTRTEMMKIAVAIPQTKSAVATQLQISVCGIATAILGILGRVTYHWKGLEKTFPTVCHTPKIMKVAVAILQTKTGSRRNYRFCLWNCDCNFGNFEACDSRMERFFQDLFNGMLHASK